MYIGVFGLIFENARILKFNIYSLIIFKYTRAQNSCIWDSPQLSLHRS